MRNLSRALLIVLALPAFARSAVADDEASNVAHVVAGPYGRCYAKSVPDHVYDPADEPRQQGRTMVYRVGNSEDVLVQRLDWFSQRLFVRCGPADGIVVCAWVHGTAGMNRMRIIWPLPFTRKGNCSSATRPWILQVMRKRKVVGRQSTGMFLLQCLIIRSSTQRRKWSRSPPRAVRSSRTIG